MTDINIRELSRKMKEITNRAVKGESFTVYKNSKPVFQIQPAAQKDVLPKHIKRYTASQVSSQKKQNSDGEFVSLHERFKDLMIKDKKGLQNISNEIDEILYK